jgi:glycosyltransferase involved in cell wall biosynthesis
VVIERRKGGLARRFGTAAPARETAEVDRRLATTQLLSPPLIRRLCPTTKLHIPGSAAELLLPHEGILQTGAMPLLSVVVIFLNAERYLEEAVQSVRDQELADWELILVDDGSTDRSTLIAREMADEDDRIRYVDHPGHENRGMSASRNLGAALTTGPLIAFLDADDVWAPGKLAEQVDLLERMPDVAMVSGATLRWYSWDPASTEADRAVAPGGFADQRLDPPEAALTLYPLRERTGPVCEVLVRRSAFEAVSGFEERFRGLYEDQAFYIKVYLRYPIYISSRSWLRYRQHDASHCGKLSRGDAWRRRDDFLDWLQELEHVGQLDDPRVSAAVRRRRRQLPYLMLAAPALDLVDRLRARASEKLKNRRAMSGRSLATHGMAELEPGAGVSGRPSRVK